LDTSCKSLQLRRHIVSDSALIAFIVYVLLTLVIQFRNRYLLNSLGGINWIFICTLGIFFSCCFMLSRAVECECKALKTIGVIGVILAYIYGLLALSIIAAVFLGQDLGSFTPRLIAWIFLMTHIVSSIVLGALLIASHRSNKF